MPRLAVLGGSVVGSATALMFARSGWDVTVVEPELDRIRDDRPEGLAPRPGAPHTVQAHGFMARTLYELTTRLPDVRAEIVAAGAPVLTARDSLPPHLYDGGRDDDRDLDTLRVRRVVLDRAVADVLHREPGLRLVAQRAVGLLADPGDPPTVRGVRLADGAEVAADVVVDATGRRSPVMAWLGALGVAPVVREDPCDARYYTRHFRVRDGGIGRLNRGFAEVHDFPSLTQLLFLGDNGTAMLAQSVHDEDPVLKALRNPDAFDATAGGNEELADWWAVLEPISDVFALGAFSNRLHRLVRDDRPVVRGLHLVGDALARTNPTRGRGLSMGLAAAGRLHDLLVVDGLAGDDAQLALDGWVTRSLAVYYRETAAVDEAVSRRLRAGMLGRSVPINAPAIELPEGHPVTSDEVSRVAGSDPELIRLVIRATMLLDDDRRIAAPEVAARVVDLLGTAGSATPEAQAPTRGFHDRQRLLATLAPYA